MAHSQDHDYIPEVLKFPDPLKDSLTFKYHNPTEQVFDTDIWEVFQIQARAHCYLLKYVGDYWKPYCKQRKSVRKKTIHCMIVFI